MRKYEHCIGKLIESCLNHFYLLKLLTWVSGKLMCEMHLLPLKKNKTAMHDGKSEIFSTINFWFEWGLFSYFNNQRRAQFCFALSHMIMQVIFGKDDFIL